MEFKIEKYKHKTQYYETDQMGIIHHSNYIRWFEESRTDLLEQVGFSYHQMEEAGVMIPVLGVTCDYKSMVRYGESVFIFQTIEEFSGVKMSISYEVVDSVSNEIRCIGSSRHCFVDKTMRPISLQKKNKDIFDIFKALLVVKTTN